MPPREEILRSIENITQHYIYVAIGWHVIIYLLILLHFIRKQDPGKWLFAIILSLPLYSVALFSSLGENYFNGIMLLLLATLSLVLILRSWKKNQRSSKQIFPGILLILSGFFYPHFTENLSVVFITAPMGLIPCPTLLFVIGVLIYFGSPSRSLTMLFILSALFYGLVGIFKLKVYIDILLIVSVVPMLLQIFHFKQKHLLT